MKYALITGSSKGIGLAIAEELAKRGINILLVARDEELLKAVAEDIRNTNNVDVNYLAIDLSINGASQKLFDWCINKNYSVDILVNNAGYGLSGAFDKNKLSDYNAMMQLNMNVIVELSYLFLDELKKHKQSFIVNIASSAAYQSVPGLNVYAASKSFVLSFSRGLNFELKDTNVFVVAVSPGTTDTNFANRASVNSKKAKKLAKQFNMQPKKVARIIVDGMYNKELEIVPGFVNKLAIFLAWLLPKKLLEKSAATIYDLKD